MTVLTGSIQLASRTQANWVSSNPVLLSGQIAISSDQLHTGTDQPKFKIGNGTSTWSDLDYYPVGSSSGSVEWGDITGTLSDQSDLNTALNNKQPLNSNLTDIAALSTTAFGRDFLTTADAADARSYISAGTGNGDALTTGTLAQFAATTSAQLAGVMTDETGTGSLVFGSSPTISTPTLTLANTNPTASGSIGFDQTSKRLSVGDGSTSMHITMDGGVDFSGTANPQGFSSVVVNSALYWEIGSKLAAIFVDISGTSNATTFTFTIPFTAASTTAIQFKTVDVGTIGNGRLATGSNTTITLGKSIAGAGGFTNSGTKSTSGWFIMHRA